MLGTQTQPRFKARWPHGGKAQHCLDCGGDIVQVSNGRTLRCDGCAQRAHRRKIHQWHGDHPGYYSAEAKRLRKERREATC